MSSNLSSLMLNLAATAIIAVIVYILSLLYPGMRAEPRAAVSSIIAVALVLSWRYVLARSCRSVAARTATRWKGVVTTARAAIGSVRRRIACFRACLAGEVEESLADLERERERYASERGKVDKLTAALATLTFQVCRLFDKPLERMRPDELGWGMAVAVSSVALKYVNEALSHRVTKIVYYDSDYPGSWVKSGDAENARDHFVERWFVEKNAGQLATWMREVLQSDLAQRSLIVFAQDIVPDTVAEVRNETCLIRKYLDAGGRVVWRGDIPFWYQGKAGDARDNWHGPDSFESGPWKILGVLYHNYRYEWNAPRGDGGLMWGANLPLEITPAGKDIGLAYPPRGLDARPVPCQDVHMTYVLVPQRDFSVLDVNIRGSAGDFALCWKKNFNEHYPHGGFMQYVPGDFVWSDVNDYFFRFAVSGWPLLFDE